MMFEAYQISVINQKWGEEYDDFFIQAHCEVREVGGRGGEAFELNIVSPKALSNELKADTFEYEFGRGYLFANLYDEAKVLLALQKLLNSSQATSWAELLEKTKDYFKWID